MLNEKMNAALNEQVNAHELYSAYLYLFNAELYSAYLYLLQCRLIFQN